MTKMILLIKTITKYLFYDLVILYIKKIKKLLDYNKNSIVICKENFMQFNKSLIQLNKKLIQLNQLFLQVFSFYL